MKLCVSSMTTAADGDSIVSARRAGRKWGDWLHKAEDRRRHLKGACEYEGYAVLFMDTVKRARSASLNVPWGFPFLSVRRERHQSRLPGELQSIHQPGVGVWVSVRSGLGMSAAALEQRNGADQFSPACCALPLARFLAINTGLFSWRVDFLMTVSS